MTYASYQTAQPEAVSMNEDQRQPGVTVRAQTGAISIDAEGNVSERAPRGLNTADFSATGDGILATARGSFGSPVMGEIKGTDIIKAGGYEMTVAVAEQLGMVARDANGRYVEVSGGVNSALSEANQPEQEPVDEAEAFSDPKAEAALAGLCEGVSPGLQVGVLQEIITNGQADPRTIARAAHEVKVEPEKMGAEVQSVMAHFEAQAVKAVQGYGAQDPSDFFDWARQNRPNDFKHAMQAHGMERSTKGYEPIFREYVSSMAEHDPEAVLNATFGGGITAQRLGKDVVLNIPGRGQLTYRSALKAGLIKVSGA